VKIGPVDTEIALLIVKKKKLWKVKYIALSSSLPSRLNKIHVILTLVLQWYFTGVSEVLCHQDRPNIPMTAILMSSRVSFSMVPMPTFTDDSFTPKLKMVPENRK